jgi:zinc protease
MAFASNVSEFTLKNGLKILVKPDTRAPVAIFQIWYRVGGSYEPNGLTGISHVLEHMMFEGTKNYPNETYSKVVNENGGQLNAFTSDDYTAYYEEFSADKINLAFKMEADRMRFATLSEAAFKKEIQVVMEERRMRYDDQPAMRLYERLRAAAFLSSPYHHMTIGWMGDLKNLNIANVRDWYNAWYVPNNATIVIVGNVKPAKMQEYAEEYFSDIPKQALLVQKPVVEQEPIGVRSVNASLPAKVSQLFMTYNVPVLTQLPKAKAWKAYALALLSGVLSGSDSSRFSQNLIRGEKVAASASSRYDPTSRLNALFELSGVPSAKGTVESLVQAFNQQLTNIKTKLIKPAELMRVKTQIIAQKVYGQDSLSAQASQLGSLISVGLPYQLSDNYVKAIEKVTPEQIQLVANEFLTKQRLTTAVLHPLPMSTQAAAKQQLAQTASQAGVK